MCTRAGSSCYLTGSRASRHKSVAGISSKSGQTSTAERESPTTCTQWTLPCCLTLFSSGLCSRQSGPSVVLHRLLLWQPALAMGQEARLAHLWASSGDMSPDFDTTSAVQTACARVHVHAAELLPKRKRQLPQHWEALPVPCPFCTGVSPDSILCTQTSTMSLLSSVRSLCAIGGSDGRPVDGLSKDSVWGRRISAGIEDNCTTVFCARYGFSSN